MTTRFENIFHGLGREVGELRIASSGLGWKVNEGEASVKIPAADIKYIQWLRVARNFQLRIIMKENRHRETFDGFLREDHDKIATVVKQHFDIALEVKEISLKGWNWGATDVQGTDLAFLISNKTAFEIPLDHISNSNIAGKTEVSLELTNPDRANQTQTQDGKKKASKGGDELVEIRLYVPGTHTKGGGDDEEGEEEEEEEDEETSAAQAFHDMIKDKADIGQVQGECIVVFNEVLVSTPRGRYDIDMFPTFMRLRGKTYDYKIKYEAITRLFLLPKSDEVHMQFVVGLDPPIRQGQTRYPYLVMLFTRDDEAEIELKIDEETIEAKYAGKLQKKYEQPLHEVIATIFRGLSGKKILAPTSFQSRDGHGGIKANLKAVQGELYFLEKSLIYVAKQPAVVEFQDIHQVVFSRVGGQMAVARTFDLNVQPKSGPELTFTSIIKEEHEQIENYLKAKKVRVKNEMLDDMMIGVAAALESDSDEEMASAASTDEEDQPKKVKGISMDDDEDSEEDQDFKASESDGGSPSSESDSDEEGAISVPEDEPVKKPAKKKVTKAGDGKEKEGGKKKKAAKKDSGDEEDSPAKPKQKPKPKKRDEDEDAPPKKKVKKD